MADEAAHGAPPQPPERPAPDPLPADAVPDPPPEPAPRGAGPEDTVLATAGPAETGVPPVAGPADTGVLPAVPPGPATPARWSARAQVRPAGLDQEAPAPGWELGPAPSRGALVPVLIAVCILLLASFIGLGVWLALREPGAPPALTPTPSGTGPTTKPPRSTTTRPPTPSTTAPATTEPTVVTVPQLRGSDYDTAAATLTGLGFNVARVDRPSTDVPAEHVIGTDPPAGAAAVAGLTVDVFVSTGPPSTAEPSDSPSTTVP